MSRSKGGVKYFPQYFDRAAQRRFWPICGRSSPQRRSSRPTMPRSGKPMSVRMTNCGPLGWVTDKERGYRYQATHPETGKPWPPIPPMLLDLWDEVGGYAAPPEACLVNYYAGEAKMGLHQDKDEEDFAAPVLSVSLGDTGLSASAGGRARTRPRNSSSSPAMWWCSAARTGSPFTASTASCPARRTCLPKAAASISLCAA